MMHGPINLKFTYVCPLPKIEQGAYSTHIRSQHNYLVYNKRTDYSDIVST